MKLKFTEPGLLILSILFSLLTASAVMELIYTRNHPLEIEHQYIKADFDLGWDLIPGRLIPSHPFGRLSINRDGFRSQEILPGTKKILLLGDSVAFGYGTADDQTLSYFLGQGIPAGYQVLNGGVPGYGIDQTYLRLVRTLKNISGIEKAVLVLFPNDSIEIMGNVLFGNRKPYFSLGKDSALTLHPIAKWDLRYWISQVRFLKRCLSLDRDGDRIFAALVGDKVLSEPEREKVFRELLRNTRSLLSRNRIETVIVLSPYLTDLEEKSPWFSRMETILREEKIPYLNLYDEFKGKKAEALFCDEAHLSEEGNQTAAALIAPLLFQTGKENHVAAL